VSIRSVSIPALALTLSMALGVVHPCDAGSVTYDFIEGAGAPNPGTVGGILTFASPPASPDTSWSTSSVADVLDFQITDKKISAVGSYNLNGSPPTVTSLTGARLDSGNVYGFFISGGYTIDATFSTNPGQSIIVGYGLAAPSTPGDWALATAVVPEPSSLVMGSISIALMGGIIVLKRRRS
jgi:hypothetical protein